LFLSASFLLLQQECVIAFGRGKARNQGIMVSPTLSLLAKNRGAVLVAAVANTASLLFGYDTGVAGSVVALQRFASPRRLSPIVERGRQVLLTKGYTASDLSLNTLRILLKRPMSLLISSRC
jgi:hypothetical protein